MYIFRQFQVKRPIEKLDLDPTVQISTDDQQTTIKHEPPLMDQWLINAQVSPDGTHGSSEGLSLVSICSQSSSSSRPWVYPQDEKGFLKSQSPAKKGKTFILSARFQLPCLEMRDSSSSLLSVMMRPLVMQYAKQQQRLNRDGEQFEANARHNTYITIISCAAYQFHNDRNEVSKLYHH